MRRPDAQLSLQSVLCRWYVPMSAQQRLQHERPQSFLRRALPVGLCLELNTNVQQQPVGSAAEEQVAKRSAPKSTPSLRADRKHTLVNVVLPQESQLYHDTLAIAMYSSQTTTPSRAFQKHQATEGLAIGGIELDH